MGCKGSSLCGLVFVMFNQFQMNSITTLLLTGFCITMGLSESPAEHQTSEVQTYQASQSILTSKALNKIGTYRRDLRKRSASLAAKGLAAVEAQLTGTKKGHITRKAIIYRKNGNRQTALNDFKSVEPVLTRSKTYGRDSVEDLHMGTVGDRRLILKPYGDRYSRGRPVLEIRSATDSHYIRIDYMTEK